jgi:hypothetical protein
MAVWLGRNGSAKINIENNKIAKGPFGQREGGLQ